MNNLEREIKKFEKWYYTNFTKEMYTSIGVYENRNEIHNFIEKMAIWYELRYPDSELIKNTSNSIDDIMFKNNYYINFLFNDYTNNLNLKWSEFYDYDKFYNSLSVSEKFFFKIPIYNNLVYLCRKSRGAHLHLDKNGYIIEAEFLPEKIEECYNSFNGKVHVKDFITKLENNKIYLPKDNEIKPMIEYVEKNKIKVEKLLDCVMYKIISRGGERIGARRGLLFAKEFNRNIDIPMIYGVDRSDPDLCDLIDSYLELGGNLYLACFENYFSKESNKEKDKIVILKDIYNKELEYVKQKRIELK